ncbi:putative Peptidylprolyl isomerase [Candidatus Defluviicoccus seviourii]|uniref:Parvulin-like PPIase n=1 Tax=Candidatus Defluviicoccus seviourii TaxID=2565273 RepID=A0A564WH86_9PROT|nr:putative Peptidylprolyl isomerase [Candidatus Defluviicoccus seviourii]
MLEAIRNRASSLIVKLLFLVLVLSFVMWGIADVFSPARGRDWIAKVGDATISAQEFAEVYDRTLRSFSASLGQPIDREQARALGLPASAMDQLIGQTLLDQAAADLGIVIDDKLVRSAIAANKRFHNAMGQFDADAFRDTLSVNNLNEERYVAILRSDLSREQLIGSIAAVPGVPAGTADLVFRYRGERRTARSILIPFAAFSDQDVGAADEAALRTLHEEQKDRFTTPELREVSALILTAEQVAADAAVSDDAVRAAFQERIDEFSTPERRSFLQMVFDDQATASSTAKRLAEGADFAALAKELLGEKAGDLAVEAVARADLPEALADAVFALQPGGASQPIETPLGWHVVRLSAIEPAQAASFETVAPRLRAELAKEKAADELIRAANRLDDALGRGSTLEDAAAELNLRVRTIPSLDSSGADENGKPIPDLPSELVATAFVTAENGTSLLVEAADNTYFVVHVNHVRPSAVKPFETVKTEVAEAWRAEKRVALAKAKADTLAERARQGQPLARLAAEAGVKETEVPAIGRDRQAEASTLPQAFVSALFAAKAGEAFVVRGPDGFLVGQLGDIRAADPAADPSGRDREKQRLTQAMRSDLVQQFVGALRQRYPVSVNQAAIESQF